MAICLQDLPFYEESGGGITISGGEGMSQPDFLRELLPALKKHNLHLAIETIGYVPEDVFQELAPMFDLLLFDIKHADSKKHQAGTKVGNELIRKNLKWAIEQHIEILPRIPVIPHFNDSLDDAKLIATYLKELGLKKVQLLPFHQMGEKNINCFTAIMPTRIQKPYIPKTFFPTSRSSLIRALIVFSKSHIISWLFFQL